MFMPMSHSPHDLTHEILKQLRADIADFRRSVDARFDSMDERFRRNEDMIAKQRRDTAALLVMMKSVVGAFEERITSVESRLTVLETGAR
jgi:hypothetical protein